MAGLDMDSAAAALGGGMQSRPRKRHAPSDPVTVLSRIAPAGAPAPAQHPCARVQKLIDVICTRSTSLAAGRVAY
jgi:hypothetical protein